jgi:hypothetical protein
MLLSSGIKKGKRTETQLIGPVIELASFLGYLLNAKFGAALLN